MQEDKKITRFLKKRPMVTAGLAVAAIVVLGVIILEIFVIKDKDPTKEMPTFVAKQGPLRISIIESGTINAREQVVIKNEIEGTTTILSLVPEGTLVKKGDLLVELDASKLLDEKIDQEIVVQNADADFVQARENLAVVENQAQSDMDIAELTLEFAKQDLEKYIKGEYPTEVNEAKAQITLAKEELQRAEENLKWSKKLYEEKYLSQMELQADELAVNKKKLDLELAESNLQLLKDFTYKRQLAQLESNVKQAKMALERTIRKAGADVVQAKAKLTAKESELERQKDKLKKFEEQIAKAKIYAPADGLVIYATSAKGSWHGNSEPLEEGSQVREREELIYLPTALSMRADVKIHEASMKKVEVGLPAIIKVDALLDKVFTGRVAKIAPLPDAQMVWLNPDLKVYNAEIYIDGEDINLRTGMSCNAEIIVEEYRDATYIPLQAVVRIKNQPTVYVSNGKSFEPREVNIGLDNNKMVRILKGLQPGENVLLTPPFAPASVEHAEEAIVAETTPSLIQKPLSESSEQEPVADKQEGKQKRSDRAPGETGTAKLTAEQRQKMREEFEKMSPEEKEKVRQRRKNKEQESDGNK